MKRYCNYLANQQGVALMMVLWVMLFLTIIVTEFAFSMRTEVNITRNFKEDVQSYYLARAGIALALAEILNPKVKGDYAKDEQLIFKLEGEETGYLIEGQDAPALFPPRQDIPLGAGTVSYNIMDEEGKLNLNALMAGTEAHRDILHRLLYEGAGIQMGTERDIIVDSILDWMDKDELHKLNGAEDDYYQSLNPPYDCKDGPFDTVDELVLVQGVTKQILYGTGVKRKETETDTDMDTIGELKTSYPGIAKFLSVWNKNRVNNYSADPLTLKIKYGEEKGEVMAEKIAENLENPDFNPPKSHCYSIISTGKLADNSARRSIFAVIRVIKQKKSGIVNIEYQCWNDNLVKYQFITPPPEWDEYGS